MAGLKELDDSLSNLKPSDIIDPLKKILGGMWEGWKKFKEYGRR